MKQKNNLSFNVKLDEKQKFGFRKLSVGLAAVALGTTFFLSNGQLVHADAENENPTAFQVAQRTADSSTSSLAPGQTSQDTSDSKPANKNEQPNSQQQQTVDITAHHTDSQGNSTSEIKANETPSLMAGQDTVNVDVKINHPSLDQNNSIHINLPDAGENKNYKIVTSKSTIYSQNSNSKSYWNITASDNNDFSQIIATWENSTTKDSPTQLDLNIPVIANGSTIKTNTRAQAFNVEIDGKNQTAFTADLTPYQDKVQPTELIHGFAIGKKSFNGSDSEYPEKNNISADDIQKLGLNDSSHILQWGIYFNYGNQLDNPPRSLYDAVFNVHFSDDQILIPSSIKVFEIPSGMAVDQNALRHGINDFYDGPDHPNQKYYDLITTENNEKSNFANFLRNHLTKDKNGFSVDQTGQKFNLNDPKDSYDYSTHAYYIQLDTVLDNKSGQPTTSTGMSADTSKKGNSLNGQGALKEDKTFSWNGQITGNSDSTISTTQYADVRFYDDTDKDAKAIDTLLENNGFTLLPTTDRLGQGFNANYTGQDNNSVNIPIQFAGLTNALTVLKNHHYKLEKVSGTNSQINSDGTITFGNFDNDENKDQHFVIYLVHETRSESQTATIQEQVKGYYTNGPKNHPFAGINDPNTAVPENDESATPDVLVKITYTRNRTVDLVKDPQATNTAWSEWTANKPGFPAISYNNTIIKDSIGDNYYLDKNGVVHIIASQKGITATSDPTTGISEIIPSSEFLASIASTIINKKESTPSKVATINIWVPYAYSAPQPEPNPNPEPQPQPQPTPTTPLPEKPNSDKPAEPIVPVKAQNQHQTKTITHKDNASAVKHDGPQIITITPHSVYAKLETVTSKQTNPATIKMKKANSALPETGEKKLSLSLIGLSLVALSLFGWAITKKKRN